LARLPLVSPLDRALFLKAQPYLEGLPSSSLAAMAQYAEESFFAREQALFTRGAPPSKIHFLVSGGVRTQYAVGRASDLYSPGGIGLVERLAQSEEPPAVWALEDTLALSLDAGTFMQIIEDEFVVYLSIAMNLARAAMDALHGWGSKRPAEQGFPEDRLQETFAILDLVHRLFRAREAPFFQGSNLTVLTELLRFQEPRVLQADEVLFLEGSAVESMALLLDGTFVTSSCGGETLHPAGSMIGGWEVLAHQLRHETARAVTPARIIEIDRALFTDVLEDHFEFAIDYLGKLSRRLIELRFSVPQNVPPTKSGEVRRSEER
jgi:CRP-like cAMP-binding protein